jgi:hypothetical protein
VSADYAVDAAARAYEEMCESLGVNAVAEEKIILSIGRELLPPCAIAVLDKTAPASVEYYAWLTQVAQEVEDDDACPPTEPTGGAQCPQDR